MADTQGDSRTRRSSGGFRSAGNTRPSGSRPGGSRGPGRQTRASTGPSSGQITPPMTPGPVRGGGGAPSSSSPDTDARLQQLKDQAKPAPEMTRPEMDQVANDAKEAGAAGKAQARDDAAAAL